MTERLSERRLWGVHKPRGDCVCGRTKQAKSQTCAKCRSEAAEENGNWKGGRTRHKAGYVMVRVPLHPRAGRSPYVFEHILVAEELLGRHLVEGESVHHINGVRDDNRPENFGAMDKAATVRDSGERLDRLGSIHLRSRRGYWHTSNGPHGFP